MATNLKNILSNKPQDVPSAEKMKFGIVVSEWNQSITGALYQGAKETLLKYGTKE